MKASKRIQLWSLFLWSMLALASSQTRQVDYQNMHGIFFPQTGQFWPGSTGSDWSTPEQEDLTRVKNQGSQITDWALTSWRDVNCCFQLKDDSVWEDAQTGMEDCFCREFLQEVQYKTVSFCSLKQSCLNALRDWNRVFGEGYMVPGQAPVWNTESPVRTCTIGNPDGSAVNRPCGEQNNNPLQTWTDPYGRLSTSFANYKPNPNYGKITTPYNPSASHKWRWVPGDAPASLKPWLGGTAGDGKVQAGIMKGTPVYPASNSTDCCDTSVNASCCSGSSLMSWVGPQDAPQADCMFAVKRAICAYHFWECDKSYSDLIFNGICLNTCTDIEVQHDCHG
mmetsp:Transcript_12463/g.43356  ORF Transcript_12463/g.43356 Transcript_12463/m.43356 type:complete len:337 (-) Transcript_12463:573-1583(-)